MKHEPKSEYQQDVHEGYRERISYANIILQCKQSIIPNSALRSMALLYDWIWYHFQLRKI